MALIACDCSFGVCQALIFLTCFSSCLALAYRGLDGHVVAQHLAPVALTHGFFAFAAML
jgi:hypothetical protein